MNTSILRRLFVSANQGLGADGKLWVMPAILEVFGFSSILKAFDTFDGGKRWFVWLGYATAGALLIAGGILWAVFRKRIAELWPWNKLRGKKTAVAQSGIVTLHNVQCLGVDTGERAARIGFINVEIPNREIAIFHRARLKVRYSLAGKQVEVVFPARWIGSDEYETSIGFVAEYAVLAVYIGNQWHGVETEEVLMPHAEIESWVEWL
jgi:hypothetical protein